jgi:hypothetical protein
MEVDTPAQGPARVLPRNRATPSIALHQTIAAANVSLPPIPRRRPPQLGSHTPDVTLRTDQP